MAVGTVHVIASLVLLNLNVAMRALLGKLFHPLKGCFDRLEFSPLAVVLIETF